MEIRINIRTSYLIHLFAALHALVAACCLWANMEDELLLTVLTMTLTVIICIKNRISFEMSAIFMILVNITGYIIGVSGASLLRKVIQSDVLVSSLATAVTTEIVGWLTYTAASLIRKDETKENVIDSQKRINWISTAVLVIFLLRIIYAALLKTNSFSHEFIIDTCREIVSNSGTMITTIGLNIIFIGYSRRYRKKFTRVVRSLFTSLFIIATTMIGAAITNIFLLKGNHTGLEMGSSFFQIVSVMFLIEITTWCIIYLFMSAFWSKQQMQVEKEKANWEKYRYLRLKQQVNPHFLFNTLNILDCLVQEEKTEEASTYIHKMAGIYRYLIKNEEESLVQLKEELEFVDGYIDLLKVRFQEGFRITTDIAPEAMMKKLPPCSLQLLIENAIKHNTVDPSEPLEIRISSEGEYLTIENNVIPKLSENNNSTGIGQDYIREHYRIISGKEIEIRKTDQLYSVTLPLL